MFGYVLVFAVAEIPDFIALDSLASDVAQHLVLVFKARLASFFEQARDGVLGNARDPHGGADRIAFEQASDNRTLLVVRNCIHTDHYA